MSYRFDESIVLSAALIARARIQAELLGCTVEDYINNTLRIAVEEAEWDAQAARECAAGNG